MKLPNKVLNAILIEAKKEARFSWYSGWEKSSGYIKSELHGQRAFGSVRIYIKWTKKKEPTTAQIEKEIENYIDLLLDNKEHHQTQREFTSYLLQTFYVDVKRLEHEAMMSIHDNLQGLIEIIEKSDDFCEPRFQNLHNDLKNLECAISDHGAIEKFLESGRKHIGE